MTIRELVDEITRSDGFGRTLTENPDYEVVIETPEGPLKPLGIRWEHHDGQAMIETEAL